jgi:hypothetical protein
VGGNKSKKNLHIYTLGFSVFSHERRSLILKNYASWLVFSQNAAKTNLHRDNRQFSPHLLPSYE